MKILYVFPHPDDESFGPAPAMVKQLREGHKVYLLTLTKGGATKQRYKYGLSIDEMGIVRYKEMLDVEKVLGLTGMTVLDLPDSGLKELDPREIENVIEDEIGKIKPNVVVTYPVHGISGFHDHLVCHAVVKNVFVKMKEKNEYLKRLAFFTIPEDQAAKLKHFHLSGSKDEEIDCIYEVEDKDVESTRKALDCYVTFKETIDATDIKNQINTKACFEIFGESHDPKLKNIFEKLPN
ncbi:MAG: PIG-L family deacetylase [Ignavibacteria bacterium]